MTDSLPQRMREAAKVLREASHRHGTGHVDDERGANEMKWNAVKLGHWADRWEAEDNAAAEREAMVEELARWLYSYWPTSYPFDEDKSGAKALYMAQARRLIDAGWTKADPK